MFRAEIGRLDFLCTEKFSWVTEPIDHRGRQHLIIEILVKGVNNICEFLLILNILLYNNQF